MVGFRSSNMNLNRSIAFSCRAIYALIDTVNVAGLSFAFISLGSFINSLSIVMYESQAGEFMAKSIFSLPQIRFLMISRTMLLFSDVSSYNFSSLTIGAMKMGDSKQTAISFKNLRQARKFKFGRSFAKLMYFMFSFFSMSEIVLFM